MIQAFSARSDVECHSSVDERSAAFMALGLSIGLKKPVAICCTSGTAALNFYPAVAEAFYSGNPLLVITADRPPERIDNWEGQCIRQSGLFDQHILSSYDTPASYGDESVFVKIATQAYTQAQLYMGPVHVNMPFEEPFYEDSNPMLKPTPGFEDAPKVFDPIPQDLEDELKAAQSVLWLNGASCPKGKIRYNANMVVLSDVISNQGENMDHWEAFISSSSDLEDLSPDLIITTGSYFLSKKLRIWLAGIDHLTHWHMGSQKEIPTPFKTQPRAVNCDPQEVADLLKTIGQNHSYVENWESRMALFKEQFNSLPWGGFTEFSVVSTLYDKLPDRSVLHVSNSMPIRYVGYLKKRGIDQYSNRGTSGIDGCTSTALGFAKTTSEPVFLFTGDLAFFYDANAFWTNDIPTNLKVIMLNNQGGGIFRLIDGPSRFPQSLVWQTTPHQRSGRHVADDHRLGYFTCSTWAELTREWEDFLNHPGCAVLEVKTDMKFNEEFYSEFKHIKV